MRRLIYAAAAILAISALAWALWPQPLKVETAGIGRHTITVTVEDEGTARVREVFTLSAPVTGELQRISLHAGDDVTENQTVIASIRPPNPGLLDARSNRMALAAVNTATASVAVARAELRQAEAQLAFTQGELSRITPLARKGTVSDQSYDRAVIEELTARTTVERARANVTLQQGNLESARAALTQSSGLPGEQGASCCVEARAPVSGKILRVLMESQQVVQAGTPLVEIGNPADLEITADLLSRDAVRIAPGAPALIDGWGGTPLAAKVRRIDPAATTKISALGIEEQRVNVVLDLIDPANATSQLGHGFRVLARITVWQGENLLAVPVSALFRSGNDWVVFVADNGRARLQKITIGHRSNIFAEIISGLTEGELVIEHPADAIADGARVEVMGQ